MFYSRFPRNICKLFKACEASWPLVNEQCLHIEDWHFSYRMVARVHCGTGMVGHVIVGLVWLAMFGTDLFHCRGHQALLGYHQMNSYRK